MGRPHPGEGAIKPKARYQPEVAAVDATGLWHKGHVLLWEVCRSAPGSVRRRDGTAEDSSAVD